MPAQNINPTYLNSDWTLLADWTLQYKVKSRRSGGRVSWKSGLGQVTAMRSSVSFQLKRGDRKEPIVKVFTNTMEEGEPELALRISKFRVAKSSSELRTALQGKSSDQIASTSL